MGMDCGKIAPAKGDARYRALLDQMWEVHCKKAADYGNGEQGDFLANLRASEAFGLPAWLGAMIRLNDKVVRLQAYAKKRTLANEGVEDSLIDLAAYALLTLILHREAKDKEASCDRASTSPGR